MRDINIYFLTFCNQAVQTVYPYSPVPDINSEMGIVQWLGPFMGWIGLGHIFTTRRYSSAVHHVLNGCALQQRRRRLAFRLDSGKMSTLDRALLSVS